MVKYWEREVNMEKHRLVREALAYFLRRKKMFMDGVD